MLQRIIGFFACVIVVMVPDAFSFRVKKHAVDVFKHKRPSSQVKATLTLPGRVELDSRAKFKIIKSNDSSITYDVDLDKAVVYCDRNGGNQKMEWWLYNVKPADILIRGSFYRNMNLHNVDVTVLLSGTIRKLRTSHIFQPDVKHNLPQSTFLVVPTTELHISSEGILDYSVKKVTRQGETIFEGDIALFQPATYFASKGESALHKEMVVQEVLAIDSSNVIAEAPFYVKGKGYCGVELFTRSKMYCELTESHSNSLHNGVVGVASLAPTNPRGFGLEFELVSRPVPNEIAIAADADIKQHKLPNNVEAYTEVHANNYGNRRVYEKVVKAVQHVNYCFRTVLTSYPSNDKACTSYHDCNLNQYCTKAKRCSTRSKCNPNGPDQSIDGACPMSLKLWNWESDVSVKELSKSQIKEIPHAADDEAIGDGLEIVSPGPPNVLSGKAGIESAAELLGVLRRQGVQAGPSQGLHVHVNAISPDVPGQKLSIRGIASVWIAWAKYQLVLDEMLSPGRPDNSWSARLFLAAGKPWENTVPKDCRDDPATCTAIFYMNMRGYIKDNHDSQDDELGGPSDVEDFLDTMFATEEDPFFSCESRYPTQRYFQINLLPLFRYGTIEFRPHSATTKTERVARWVQFVTAFVEHFGNTKQGLDEAGAFLDEDAEPDFYQLRDAQRSASMSELFTALRGKVDSNSHQYYSERKWEQNDQICAASKQNFASNGYSMLELRSDAEAMEKTQGKERRQTPVEIKVPVPQQD